MAIIAFVEVESLYLLRFRWTTHSLFLDENGRWVVAVGVCLAMGGMEFGGNFSFALWEFLERNGYLMVREVTRGILFTA